MKLNSSEPEIVCLMLLGDPLTGKTAILSKYVKNIFKDHFLPTLGADLWKKMIKINDKEVKLVLIDVPGNIAVFNGIVKKYLKPVEGFIYVFDLTRIETLDNLRTLIYMMRETLESVRPFIIVGNKKDLREKLEPEKLISDEKIQDFVKEAREVLNYEGEYIEISALTGENLEEMFLKITKTTYEFSRKN